MKTYFFQDTFDPRTGTVIDCHCTPEPDTQHDGRRDPNAVREAWIRLQSRSVRDADSVTPDPDAARAAWLRRQTLADTAGGTRPVTFNDARENPPDPDAARAAWVQRLVSASKALP